MRRTLTERLELIFDWYQGMVNEKTWRLHYMYSPEENAFSTDSSPIRDIASVWDMEILSDFLNKQDLRPSIDVSLNYFSSFCTRCNGHMILDSKLLQEPSSIAHNAFMSLVLLYSPSLDKKEHITLLVNGILRQQRQDGSYKIYFGNELDNGLDFYPGEAMLALLAAYKLTNDERYLDSVQRGFSYYKSQYYEKGRVEPGCSVFFANWQSQYCYLLFQNTKSGELRKIVKDYIFQLHDKLIAEGFYERVKKHPKQQSSVEVACAAEGLNEAYSIAVHENDRRKHMYRESICAALSYLLVVQSIRNCAEKETGGFGFSLTNRIQRIDVTGHVVSAFIKSLQNDISC